MDQPLYDPSANLSRSVDKTAHYLGADVANLINLFNPQLIDLGEWTGPRTGEYILSELRQVVVHYALKQPFSVTRIELSQLGQDAVAVGAAALTLNQFLLTAGSQNPLPAG